MHDSGMLCELHTHANILQMILLHLEIHSPIDTVHELYRLYLVLLLRAVSDG